MDTGRGKSIVLFVLLGVFFVGGIVFAFLILPNMNRTLGNTDLKVGFPLDMTDLRVLDDGVGLFCKNKAKTMTFEVREGSRVMAVKDGTVSFVGDGTVKIELDTNIEVEYSSLSRISVQESEYVLLGDTIGYADSGEVSFGITDTKERVYLCPYVYFNDEGKEIVNRELDKIDYFDSICLCDNLNF